MLSGGKRDHIWEAIEPLNLVHVQLYDRRRLERAGEKKPTPQASDRESVAYAGAATTSAYRCSAVLRAGLFVSAARRSSREIPASRMPFMNVW